jgi:hypothetical protein
MAGAGGTVTAEAFQQRNFGEPLGDVIVALCNGQR